MHAIIDTAQYVGDRAAALAAAGVKTVIRYYNRANSSVHPTKCLTKRERDQLFAAGLSIAVVFQQRGGAGDPPGHIEDLTAATGVRDATRALELAGAIAQPEGSAIYFGVDHDFAKPGELASIAAYFASVRATLGKRYRVGVYGGGAVCRAARDAGSADLIWLAAARKWLGTQAALAANDWTLDQRYLEIPTPFDHDGNLFNPAYADFGQFTAQAAIPSPKGEGFAAIYRVNARGGLNLRPSPDSASRVIQSLAAGTEVRGLGVRGSWMQVDLQGDGLADGYMASEYLSAVTGGLPLDLPPARTPIDVARAEMALGVAEVPGPQHNPRIVMYHATTTGGGASDETAWCSSFVNYCVEQAGSTGTDSKWARSWHDTGWGHDVTANPREGDIVIWRRYGHGDEGGHVAFYLDSDADTIRVLGGNQGNKVQISRYPRNGEAYYHYSLLSIRRP